MAFRAPSVHAAMRAMYELARLPAGVSVGEACSVTCSTSEIASARLRWMVRTKRLEQRSAREGRTQKRYFALRPEETFEQMERRVELQKAERHDRRMQAANTRLRSAAPCKVVKPRSGGPIVTVAPPPRDRYQVDRVPRYFSAVAIGIYPLSADTWARRVTEGAA